MKTLNYICNFDTDLYSNSYLDIKSTLFFDIETTGLSPNNSMIYLIGIIRYNEHEKNFLLTQWFADTPNSESELICAFYEELGKYRTLAHFNGDTFDIPFIAKRANLLNIPTTYRMYRSFDIYKTIKPLKRMLSLNSLKQKSIEEFLGIFREDKYDGGALIKFYREYVLDHSKEKEELLLLHNHDDMIGMMKILPILRYSDVLNSSFDDISYELSSDDSLMLYCHYKNPFPVTIGYKSEFAEFFFEMNVLKIIIPIINNEVKCFFPNYKDYFYLPLEDTAIHKSVAQFVDKQHRIKATKETCYIKVSIETLNNNNNLTDLANSIISTI